MNSKDTIMKLLSEAWKYRGKGNYKESKLLLEQAKERCSPDDFDLLGRISHIHMQHAYDHKNFQDALEFSRESVAYYTQAQNLDRMAHAIRHKADLHSELGQLDTAESHYLSAIDLYREKRNSHKGDWANALRGYALLLEQQSKYEQALKIWRK